MQICAGATHALACAMGAVLDPGDELLVLAPHWPLIRGIAQARSVVAVEVPFSQILRAHPDADPAALIEVRVRPRTRAIYLCTPNNPDGAVFTERELRAVAEVAERHGLWILADEVYEDFVYDGGVHRSIAALPGIAARTITVGSFSKSFALAGARIGYAAGPATVIGAMRKMSNHSIYNVPHAVQRAALGALDGDGGGEGFLAAARTRYAAARDLALASVKAPCAKPEGATYLFLDLRAWTGGHGCVELLERFADAGVLLAPGGGFGEAFAAWARLCFTAVDEARLTDGIARINRVLET